MAPSDQRPGTPQGRAGVSVIVVDPQGRRLAAAGLAAWLRRVAPRSLRGTITVALVPDARVRTLNRRYRGKDYATDVLSFPGDAHPRTSRAAPPRLRTSHPRASGARHLGDIVIATGVAARQAREVGHTPAAELKVLALHGLLHLAGYDHERDNGRMGAVEQRLRRKGGLGAGLIERSEPRTRAAIAAKRTAAGARATRP